MYLIDWDKDTSKNEKPWQRCGCLHESAESDRWGVRLKEFAGNIVWDTLLFLKSQLDPQRIIRKCPTIPTSEGPIWRNYTNKAWKIPNHKREITQTHPSRRSNVSCGQKQESNQKPHQRCGYPAGLPRESSAGTIPTDSNSCRFVQNIFVFPKVLRTWKLPNLTDTWGLQAAIFLASYLK